MAPPILEFLSLRTFSSVWYWIAVAVTWATVSHRPMGVPYDLVRRAHGEDGMARTDLETVARALARRLVGRVAEGGAVMVALASALLTVVALLSVLYRSELAQGVFLIALPLCLVALLNLRTARVIGRGGEPARHLRRLRATTNAIGLAALLVTAFWGMYVNLVVSVL